MRLQSIITGAANRQRYSIIFARIGDYTYIAYAKAFNVVILRGNDLQVCQTLPSPEDVTDIITSLTWNEAKMEVHIHV